MSLGLRDRGGVELWHSSTRSMPQSAARLLTACISADNSLFCTCAYNAWIVYKECVDLSISIFEFQKAVAYKLCKAQDPSVEPNPEPEC